MIAAVHWLLGMQPHRMVCKQATNGQQQLWGPHGAMKVTFALQEAC